MILAKEYEGELWIKASLHNREVKRAVEAEREACAALCFQMWNDSLDRRKLNHPDAEDCAAAIRARGDALTKLNQAAEDNGEEL